jgi:hypothetical protein
VIRRAGIIALLVFQAVWLNVILPGHTRGVITVPGAETDARHTCCAAPQAQHTPNDNPPPAKNRAGNCAVCFFAARLSLPTVVDLTPAPLGLAEVRPVPQPDTAVSVEFPAVYQGRAPPAA